MFAQLNAAPKSGNATRVLLAAFAVMAALFVHSGRANTADANWLSEEEMHAAFSGATLEGKYGNGRPFTEIYQNDGNLEYREAANVINGKWSVEAGAFCTIYDNDSSGGCYRVKKASINCYEFYFVARTEQQAQSKPEQPSWTARGSIVGKPGICTEEQNV